MAIVPDNECKTPTLIVSAACDVVLKISITKAKTRNFKLKNRPLCFDFKQFIFLTSFQIQINNYAFNTNYGIYKSVTKRESNSNAKNNLIKNY